jgi:transposase
LVERVRIVLLAAKGVTNLEISRRVGCTAKTASKWRIRFAKSRRKKPAVLADAPRSGRPTAIPHWVRLELVKLACDRPVKHKQRFRDVWTLAALRVALSRETGFWLSVSEIRRVLRAEQIRPHHVRLWLHSPDPEFRPKVRAICNEYLRTPALGETVVCVDEKTGMQALEHKHPLELPAARRAGRREFEYVRHGTRTLFAAFNPHTGEVFGRCSKRRRYDDLMRFMEQLARHYPRGRILSCATSSTRSYPKWIRTCPGSSHPPADPLSPKKGPGASWRNAPLLRAELLTHLERVPPLASGRRAPQLPLTLRDPAWGANLERPISSIPVRTWGAKY